MSRTYKTEAVVIHCRDLGEKDRIVSLLSPQFGIFDAVSKGSKKITSKSMGLMEPFNLLNLMASKGKSLDLITQSELVFSFPTVRRNLSATAAALYFLNMIKKSTDHHEENPPLYNLLKASLYGLERGVPPATSMRAFEIKLIHQMGYSPEVDSCTVCQEKGSHTYFSFSHGGVVCSRCREKEDCGPGSRVMTGTLKVMKYLETSNQSGLGRIGMSEPMERELEKVLKLYMSYNIPGLPVEDRNYKNLMS